VGLYHEEMEESKKHETFGENRFNLLMDILKILEHHKDPEVMQGIIEIIDKYDCYLTPEQRAMIFKEFLHFRRKDTEQHVKLMEEIEYRNGIRQFMKGDYL